MPAVPIGVSRRKSNESKKSFEVAEPFTLTIRFPTMRDKEIPFRVVATMLLIFPRVYRQRFGEEILKVFQDDWEHTSREGGLSKCLPLLGATIVDLFKTGLEERYRRLSHLAR